MELTEKRYVDVEFTKEEVKCLQKTVNTLEVLYHQHIEMEDTYIGDYAKAIRTINAILNGKVRVRGWQTPSYMVE